MLRQPRLREIILGLVMGIALVLPASADGGTIARVRAWHITCSTTAQSLAPPAVTGAPNVTGAQSFKLFNDSAGNTIFLGGADLTNANTATKGAAYLAGTSDPFDGKPEAFFCVTTAATSDVTVLAGKF